MTTDKIETPILDLGVAERATMNALAEAESVAWRIAAMLPANGRVLVAELVEETTGAYAIGLVDAACARIQARYPSEAATIYTLCHPELVN